jgi:hypothetical protein
MPIPKSNYLDLVDGAFDGTNAGDLAAAFDSIPNSAAPNHLVVHFHGGLVGHKSALSMAERLLGVYGSGGAYPMFFVWNSGALSVLANNLGEVAKEPAFQRLVRRLAQLLAGKLLESVGTRGISIQAESIKDVPSDLEQLFEWTKQREAAAIQQVTELSATERAQIEAELRQDEVLKAEAAAIAAALKDPKQVEQELQFKSRGAPPVRASHRTLMSPSVLKRIAEESPEPDTRSLATILAFAKYGAQIAAAVIGRYRHGRDHGLMVTIVEEVARTLYADSIGATVWSLMKGDTRDAFGDDPTRLGGTAFARHLEQWWRPGRRITLVGHSTGAIYIGYLLDSLDALLPAEAKVDVVFLAPACTYAFINERLPVLKRRVAGFRLFGLTDKVERGYWEVPVLYPASLLYLVSGLFEDDEVDMPIVGMQRYLGAKGPYDTEAVRNVVQWMGPRCVWAPSQAGDGLMSSSPKHGGFDEDGPTLQSLVHILRHGL